MEYMRLISDFSARHPPASPQLRNVIQTSRCLTRQTPATVNARRKRFTQEGEQADGERRVYSDTAGSSVDGDDLVYRDHIRLRDTEIGSSSSREVLFQIFDIMLMLRYTLFRFSRQLELRSIQSYLDFVKITIYIHLYSPKW